MNNAVTPRNFVNSFSVNQPFSFNNLCYTVIPSTLIKTSSSTISLSLLDFEFHIERLLSSLSHKENYLSEYVDEAGFSTYATEYVGKCVKESIKSCITATLIDFPSPATYGLTTVCFTSYSKPPPKEFNLNIKSLVSTELGYNFLSPTSTSSLLKPLSVDTVYYRRSFPQSKLCTWTSERIPLEERRAATAGETIMMHSSTNSKNNEEDVYFTEGLTSNVYFLHSENGLLLTAPRARVLAGSMASLVEQVDQTNYLNICFLNKKKIKIFIYI